MSPAALHPEALKLELPSIVTCLVISTVQVEFELPLKPTVASGRYRRPVSFMLPLPSRTLVPLGVATGSWMRTRPEYVPELGACRVAVVPRDISTFPSTPPVPVVKMIVQDEHLRSAFDCRRKGPSVIQYVPEDRVTVPLIVNPPEICMPGGLGERVQVPLVNKLPASTQLPL